MNFSIYKDSVSMVTYLCEVIIMSKYKPRNELEKEYYRLAHQADTRIRRLLDLSKQPGFENAQNWALRSAQRSIRRWSGDKATRFETKAPENKRSLRAKMADIRSFLGMKSSTKTGIKQSYKDRAETLNKRFGTSFTWETVGNFFESEVGQKLDAQYGYQTNFMAIGEIQNNEEKILNALKNNEQLNLHIDNPNVRNRINELISEYGLDITKLYK